MVIPKSLPSPKPSLAPVCPACQRAMRYIKTLPDPKNPRLDEHFYRCECGEKESQFEPRG
jgi:predicted amidophosphoribosyltransferase